jgi:hypothetical protein
MMKNSLKRFREASVHISSELVLLGLVSCSRAPSAAERAADSVRAESRVSFVTASLRAARHLFASGPDTTNDSAAAYEGVDSRGIPHYSSLDLSHADSDLLRRAYGVEDPHRLYVSDSTEEGILKYDTERKRCLTCYVNSYRIGYVSVRRTGESWEQAERRVRSTPARVFTGGAEPASTSTADLDPEVRPIAEAMLHDAKAAGFHLRVSATYRSPLREAFLMAEGRGRTHTLTSNHSYGRAIDVVVDDGNRGHARTKEDWIAFRRWVVRYRAPSGKSFRVLGRLDHTWDWPHVELPSSEIGFRTIDDAIRRARECLASGATISCNFPPHLPPQIAQSLAGRFSMAAPVSTPSGRSWANR